jgi:hypothetical protein
MYVYYLKLLPNGYLFLETNINIRLPLLAAKGILVVDKDRVITVAIMIGLFGGLVGGPITSLIYYDAAPEERFYLFILPEIIWYVAFVIVRQSVC